MLAGRDSGI